MFAQPLCYNRCPIFQTYDVVKTFVDKIYSSLAMKEIELELTTDLASVFAILTLASNEKEEVTVIDDDVSVSVIDEVTLNTFDLVGLPLKPSHYF